MEKRRFKHRVAVYSGAALHYCAPGAAEHLLDAGLAVVRQRSTKVISSIELTKQANGCAQGQTDANRLGLRAGSFGICVETFASGVSCYKHGKVWEEVKPRA